MPAFPFGRSLLMAALAAAGCATSEPPASAGPGGDRSPLSGVDPAYVGADTIGDPIYPSLGNGGYDVTAYDVHVSAPFGTDTSTAADPSVPTAVIRAAIRATSTQALDRFTLDYAGITVSEVSVDGRPAAFTETGAKLVVSPAGRIAEGTGFEVAVRIEGRPRAVRSLGWLQYEDEVVAFGIYEGLPTWLPSNADPADKATVDLYVDVPQPATAVGPGILLGVTPSGASRTFHWRTGETNTISFVAREYEEQPVGSPLGFPVTSYVPPSLGERARARLDVVPDLLRMLADRFGPYPYEALTLAWVEHATGVPDEGLVLWGSDFSEPRQLAHILGHQWFSTNASPARPVDSWLRSAFANYCDLLWTELDRGTEGRDVLIRDWYERLGQRTEPPSAPRAVVSNQALFSRGPLGLHALRVLVGDETFFAILQTWLREHHRGSAPVAAFLETAERVSGRDLDRWWQDWLVDERVPDIGQLGLE